MRKLKRYKPTGFLAADSHYDKKAADFVVAFIESICHTKGTWAGQKFDLIEWQEQIVRDVFGTLKTNEYRQFNTAYIEIAKKQGKSELAAAIALLLCCSDGEERAACESAKQNPAEENTFRQLRLNQWVKQTVRWMPMDKWDNCDFAVNEQELEGRLCYGGLDLSSTTDITAFVLVFPPGRDGEKYIVLPYFWIPEENIDLRVNRDHVPYDVWERQGFLYTTEGNVVHYGYIEKFIEWLGEKYNIKEIAFDRWGAVQMVQNLEGMGFTVVPFGQGFKDMSPPTKELMKLVLEQNVAHVGHPVLRWVMDNIYIKTDPAGNIKPDKEKSTEKIDGAVATIIALDRAFRNGAGGGSSVYDERGLSFI